MGVVERSREVMAVMALHEALRNVCTNSDWTYSVFWTIRPRPRLRGGGGSGCKAGDEGSLMLMWEDGYCRPAPTSEAAAAAGGNNNNEAALVHEGLHRVHSSNSLNLGDDVEEEDPVRKAFRKMSIQLYNYGEGLMGKVASDKCHKWVFRESSETEVGPLNYWQSSFDSHPPEWIDQFSAGIQTIAVIQAGHGLLQLGSCKIVAEDLHFVLRMRYTFESLENQAGGFLSQTFAPMRNRFFCGSPTGTAPAGTAAVAAAGAWPNGQASAFFQSSDFRLRLGVSSEPAAAAAAINSQDFLLRSSSTGNDDNITSLRLSLQNGSAGGDRPLSFEFRNPEHDGDGAAANNGQGLSGMKRPASSPLVSGGAARTSSLLARRMQYNNKMNDHHHLDDNSTTFQQLLESNNHNAFSSPQTAVFLTNNGTSTNSNNLDHHHHHQELMVQIPPVIANNTSPMISPNSMLSPGGSSKIQRSGNSNVSPLIQAALQEAIERSSQQQPRSGSSSHPGTPKPPSDPSRSHFPGSHPSTPNNVNSDHHFMNSASAASHPGTPRLNSAATEMHFLSSNNGSHPGTPNKHSATAAAADNYLSNTTANGCLVDHSSASTMMISSNGTGSNHDKPSDPLHIPAAAWENLKESLEMPSSNRRPSSGDMYPDFMESFFE